MVYRTEPKFVERVWGALPNPGGTPFGEIWWAWDEGDSSSPLLTATGRPCGLFLHDISPGSRPFPLLIKTLHPADRLSVQVHPGLGGGEPCKAESWIVLSAGEGASVFLGLRQGTTPGMLEEMIAAGKPEALLRRLPVTRGDILHVMPGTVHALCAGVEVLEIQTNCDITYRIWDWGRMGADGRPREIHLEKAFESIDFPAAGESSGACRRNRWYSIARTAGGEVAMPPFSALFIPGGAGGQARRHACFVAGPDGGLFDAPAEGWLAVPGSEEEG